MRRNSIKALLLLLICITLCFAASVSALAAKAKKPKKPTITSVEEVSSTTLQVSWKKAKNAKKYEIYGSVNGGNYRKLKTLKQRSFMHTNLEEGNTYAYKVRAVNGKQKSAFSAVKNKVLGWADGTELSVVSNTVSFPITIEGSGTVSSVKVRQYHTKNNPVSSLRYDIEIRGKLELEGKRHLSVRIKLFRSDASAESYVNHVYDVNIRSLSQSSYAGHKVEGSLDSNGNFILIWHQNEDSILVDYDKVNVLSVT